MTLGKRVSGDSRHFIFNVENFFETSNGRLPLKHSSVWPQTLPKRVSDDPRHFIFPRRKIFSKPRTAVSPPNMAPIGAKLCQNAFQVIPDISFFDAHKHFWRQKILSEKKFVNTPKFFSAKCLFWRSCAGLDVSGECSSKIQGQTYRFQPSTTLGGVVKKAKTVFFQSYGQKKLIPSPLQNIMV